MYRLATDPGTFVRNRLNPLYTRTAIEGVTGRDNFGRPRTALEQLTDAAQTVVPISFRSDKERTMWESFLGALGITNRRFTAETQVRKFVKDFNAKEGKPPKVQMMEESEYHQLVRALENDDLTKAESELAKLDASKTTAQIVAHFRSYPNHPFTGSKAGDHKMLAQLNDEQKKVYMQAQQERKLVADRFRTLMQKHVRTPAKPL
jgi:hypothetical protein